MPLPPTYFSSGIIVSSQDPDGSSNLPLTPYEFDGSAFPGQIVVDVISGNLYTGNIDGNLTLVGGGGGGGTPGGSSTQIQFNNAGTFSGSPALTFNSSSNVLGFTGTITGNLIPTANNTVNLGSPTNQWKSLYVSNATIYMDNVPVSLSGGNILTVAGNSVVTEVGNTGTVNISNLNVSGSVLGTLGTAAQPYVTQVGILNSLTANAITVNEGLTVAGNTQFNGDMYITGNVTLPGNVTQISGNSAQFFGLPANGFGALYSGIASGYTLLQQEIAQFSGSYNGYTQVTLRNINGGAEATADYVVTADIGTQTTGFIDLGIAGSGYNGAVAGLNNGPGTAVTPLDGYLYVQGNAAANLYGNLVLGTQLANSAIHFVVAGSNIANIAAIINPPNTTAANTTSGTLVVTGDAGISGNVYATNFIGDGSQITGLYGNANVATYLGNSTTNGDIYAGSISATGNITSNTYVVGTSGSMVDYGSGVVLAVNDSTTGYSIGLQAGNATGTNSDGGSVALVAGTPTGTGYSGLIYLIGNASVSSDLSVVGNIVTSNVFGDVGAFNSVTSNANVYTVNISATGNVSVTGNITGANVVSTRIVTRTGSASISSSAGTSTVDLNCNNYDQFNVTTTDGTVNINAPTGTPYDGQKLTMRLYNANTYTVNWDATYRPFGVLLPSSPVAAVNIYVGMIYDAADSAWDVVSVATQSNPNP